MHHENWEKKAWLAGFLLFLTIITLILSRVPGCRPEKRQTPPPAADGGDPPDTEKPAPCGKVGDIRDTAACPAGQVGKIVEVCIETGWAPASNTCAAPGEPPCRQTVFASVQPVLETKCLSCHVAPGKITDYPMAKQWAGEIARRVRLAANNNEHMPKGNAAQLTYPEQQSLLQWVKDGAPEKCPTPGQDDGFINLDDVETTILDDLNTLPSDDRASTRYLVNSHVIDAKATQFVPLFELASQKALNDVNEDTQDIVLAQNIGLGVWRFDLNSFGLGEGDWKAIEDGDRLEIASQTTKGLIIRALTGTRTPWFHTDNFIDITHRNSKVYYQLIKVPATLDLLLKNIGVNFAQDLRNLQATFVGTASSPIAEQKNRLIVRVDQERTQQAYYWQSFDINSVVAQDKNLFSFPLLNGTGGFKLFKSDASEVIYSLPNGMQAYALFNAAGARQDSAPADVVRDVESPLSAIINDANSCSRCHSAGLIPMQDQVLQQVLANADQFPGNDVEIARRLYKGANAVNATFIRDNGIFGQALHKLGINPGAPDPINQVTDRLLLNWDLAMASSFLFLTPAEFLQALEESGGAKAQIGPLAAGGYVTFAQIQAALPILVKDARLFKDPL